MIPPETAPGTALETAREDKQEALLQNLMLFGEVLRRMGLNFGLSSHSGVTLAPLIGELAAIEIVDDVRVESLSPYRPERFL